MSQSSIGAVRSSQNVSIKAVAPLLEILAGANETATFGLADLKDFAMKLDSVRSHVKEDALTSSISLRLFVLKILKSREQVFAFLKRVNTMGTAQIYRSRLMTSAHGL